MSANMVLPALIAIFCYRRELKGIEVAPMEGMWDDFVSSNEFDIVRGVCYGQFSCSNSREDVIEQWTAVVAEACFIWKVLFHNEMTTSSDTYINGDDPSILTQKSDEVWNMICVLIKGLFFFRHNLPLESPKSGSTSHFLLHAATDVLPFCAEKSNPRLSTYLMDVFQQILKSNGNEQVYQPGPILGRFPMHIAAANLSNHGLSEHHRMALRAMMKASPLQALFSTDQEGNHPLLLASQAEWHLETAVSLLQLYRASPHKSKCDTLPNLLVMIAKRSTRKVSVASSRKKKKNSCIRMKGLLCRSRNKARASLSLLKLDWIFQVIQANPQILLTSLKPWYN